MFVISQVFLSLLDVTLDDELLDVGWDGWVETLAVGNVGTDLLWREVSLFLLGSFAVLMNVTNMLGQQVIESRVGSVKKKEDNIETRKKCWLEVDVLVE